MSTVLFENASSDGMSNAQCAHTGLSECSVTSERPTSLPSMRQTTYASVSPNVSVLSRSLARSTCSLYTFSASSRASRSSSSSSSSSTESSDE